MSLTLEPFPTSSLLVPSRYFGPVMRDTSSEIHLPLGIPGFESEACLIAIEIPEQRPLVYLQSASNPDLCFLTMPVNAILHDFELNLNEEERATLLFGAEEALVPGLNVMALCILFPVEGRIQVNIAAPLVINLRKMVAVQCLPETVSAARRMALQDSGEWMPVC